MRATSLGHVVPACRPATHFKIIDSAFSIIVRLFLFSHVRLWMRFPRGRLLFLPSISGNENPLILSVSSDVEPAKTPLKRKCFGTLRHDIGLGSSFCFTALQVCSKRAQPQKERRPCIRAVSGIFRLSGPLPVPELKKCRSHHLEVGAKQPCHARQGAPGQDRRISCAGGRERRGIFNLLFIARGRHRSTALQHRVAYFTTSVWRSNKRLKVEALSTSLSQIVVERAFGDRALSR